MGRSVRLEDSRRLTGPGLVNDVPGAVIDCLLEGIEGEEFAGAWKRRVRGALRAVGWEGETTAFRVFHGGVTVFHSAPIDALYAATEINEWAWEAAAADLGASDLSAPPPIDQIAEQLVGEIRAERNPRLLELEAEAARRRLTMLCDDEVVSIGTGPSCRQWPRDALPRLDEVEWRELHDVPRILVTGTNGKTTTVRMLARILSEAGFHTGFTCTDGVYIAMEMVDGGDWSGPGGARALLRHPGVEIAVLETARGGMLRRGLAVDRAQAAAVTNVAADHLGEWGVPTLADLVDAKLIVSKAVRHGAPLVINADDPKLSAAARLLERPITWFTTRPDLAAHEAASGEVAWTLRDQAVTRAEGGARETVVGVTDLPATLDGAAAHNIANALAAAALADAAGVDRHAIRRGLAEFRPDPETSPGRTNLFDLGGVRVLVDYVHNPHGWTAIRAMAEKLGAVRTAIMTGHAGDRSDEALAELARAAWSLAPDRVAVKELARYLRGRPLGEVPEVIRRGLVEAGADEGAISTHPDELDATRALLRWARPGDLLILSALEDRPGVLELVTRLRDARWHPGRPVE